MKRLIKKSEYQVDDIISNFNIEKLLVSRDSAYKSYIDCTSGRLSKTNEPLGVWITDDNKFLLVDGYHRLIEDLFKTVQNADIKIWGIGYSDYWAIPSDKFIIDFLLPWNGLEELADEEILQNDYDEYFR